MEVGLEEEVVVIGSLKLEVIVESAEIHMEVGINAVGGILVFLQVG